MTQLTVKSLFALVLSFCKLTLRLPHAISADLDARETTSYTRSFRLALSPDIFLRGEGKTPSAGHCQPPGKEIIVVLI